MFYYFQKFQYFTINYIENVYLQNQNKHKLLSHFNSERILGYLLGLIANSFQRSLQIQTAEVQCQDILKTRILNGGLQVLQPSNPYDEEKGEARSTASTAGSTPTEPQAHNLNQLDGLEGRNAMLTLQQRADGFINALAEGRFGENLVSSWLQILEYFYKDNNLICMQEFPMEHPVQELERLLTAVLIRHQGFGALVILYIERFISDSQQNSGSGIVRQSLPKEIVDIIRLIYNTKWKIIRARQQLNRSYKEVCAPMLERLRFLLYEVRPAISLEQIGLKKLFILHTLPRFKRLVKRIIAEMRIAKKQLACVKPEDILNVTIQSQNASLRRFHSQVCISFTLFVFDHLIDIL